MNIKIKKMQTINRIHSLKVHPTKKYKKRNIRAVEFIAIHHSATISGSSDAFARYHVNIKNWPGIGYHYVIYKSGRVEQTNELTTVSYHVGTSNYKSVGICLIGDFTIEEPTKIQLKTAALLCRQLMYKLKNLKEIKGHSDFPGYSWKKCPVINVQRILNLIP